MGENTLALLRHLSSDQSPLPSLTEGYTKPTTVFFAHLGTTFFIYSFRTAKIMYTALLAVSLAYVRLTFVRPQRAKANTFWQEQKKGSIAVVAGMVGTVLVPNLIAVTMRSVLHKPMSWFTSPLAPLGLYGPASLLGSFISSFELSTTAYNLYRCLAITIPRR